MYERISLSKVVALAVKSGLDIGTADVVVEAMIRDGIIFMKDLGTGEAPSF